MGKLNMFDAWTEGVSNFFSNKSAQGYFRTEKMAMATAGACGSSCGAGDDDDQSKSSACGSSCGAGDEE